MKQEEIKPCPFCGCKSVVVEKTNDFNDKVEYEVHCTKQDCYLEYGADWGFSKKHEAVNYWNNSIK